ncbi:TonB-dependent receptor [Thermoflexibacter ruber]|uniref:Outer membrane receptor for ferrienterochelin and colicins n=1 Tax=Thermoflexibacter ruber TaxID=1003 RepID=A0A1I2ITK6_9BACT|nr:TonB-dependent receptor [Thermoflexibacter ruber]SFF45624.1 outer membrane receptor for ferrienterochelin and colicins [Thermoflexibacter ruber]
MGKIICIITILLFVSVLSFAQGSIKGKVISEGKPLPFINIALLNTNLGTISDSLGNYWLKNVPWGTYQIQFSGVGFKPFKVSVSVNKDKIATLNANLEEDLSELQAVVVTGTMKESFIIQSPVHVEVFTPHFFKKNPTQCLFDALQIVNGVRPQMSCNVCNAGDIWINGMPGAYTMVLIDGMPIVSALSTVYGLSGIPNSIIERIEVVKGPASTLYGSEAVAGLINIITKSPTKAPQFSLDAFGTGYGEYNLDLAGKFSINKTQSLISANYFNFNQISDKNGDGFTDVTLQNRISIFNKWSVERKNSRLMNLAWRYMYEDRWGGQTSWERKFRGTDSIYGESIFTKRFELIGNYQLPFDKEKIVLNYSFNSHIQDSQYGTTSYLADQKISFAQLLWDKKIGKHDLLLGSTLRYTHYDDNTPATAKENTENQPNKTTLFGIFAQDEIRLFKKQKLLLGLRYDKHPVHGNVWSPRANYQWSMNENNTLRVSYGNGFRVVNLFTEDHAALTGARRVEIREALQPERSWNINANYQKHIHTEIGEFDVDVSGFYTYFTNRIIADYFTDPDKIIYENLRGHAVSKGLALNTDFSFRFPLKINAGVTLMDVYQKEDDGTGSLVKLPQIQTSPFSGTFALSYTLRKPQITLDWTGNFFSPMHLPVVPNDYRPEKSPWYSIQNLQLTKTFGNGLQIYGGVKNLLNFMPKGDVILRAFDPFDKTANDPVSNPNGYTFDPTYIYAPMQGMRAFVGVRYAIF